MPFKVILYLIENDKNGIYGKFYQNWFLNKCARENLVFWDVE